MVAVDPFESAPVLHRETGEMYLFDVEVETFVVQAPVVIAEIAEGGPYDYWLVVRQDGVAFISVPLDSEMVPRLHEAERAFMFTFTSTVEGTSSTWCVKFAEDEQFNNWKAAFTQYMWEGRNKMSWAKAKADEQRYIGSIYEDVEMEDVEGQDDEQPEEEDLEDESDVGTSSYDEDESESDSETFNKAAKGKNEKLTVGYKNDRSFVVRGDMIGVFKHTDDNKIKWQTSINRVSDLKGKAFTPKKVGRVTRLRRLNHDADLPGPLPRSCFTTKIQICWSWTLTTRTRFTGWTWSEERLWTSGRCQTASTSTTSFRSESGRSTLVERDG